MMRISKKLYYSPMISVSICLLACQINEKSRIDPPQIFVNKHCNIDIPVHWIGNLYFIKNTGNIYISGIAPGGRTGYIVNPALTQIKLVSDYIDNSNLTHPLIEEHGLLKNKIGPGWKIDFEGSYHTQTKIFKDSPAIILPGEPVRQKIETFSGNISLYIHDKLILRQHVKNTLRGVKFSYDTTYGILAFYYQPDSMYTASTYLVRIDSSVSQPSPSSVLSPIMPGAAVKGHIKH